MNDESLASLLTEIERQNAMFEGVRSTLAALGAVELEVPTAFLDELDEVARVRPSGIAMPLNALRA